MKRGAAHVQQANKQQDRRLSSGKMALKRSDREVFESAATLKSSLFFSNWTVKLQTIK